MKNNTNDHFIQQAKQKLIAEEIYSFSFSNFRVKKEQGVTKINSVTNLYEIYGGSIEKSIICKWEDLITNKIISSVKDGNLVLNEKNLELLKKELLFQVFRHPSFFGMMSMFFIQERERIEKFIISAEDAANDWLNLLNFESPEYYFIKTDDFFVLPSSSIIYNSWDYTTFNIEDYIRKKIKSSTDLTLEELMVIEPTNFKNLKKDLDVYNASMNKLEKEKKQKKFHEYDKFNYVLMPITSKLGIIYIDKKTINKLNLKKENEITLKTNSLFEDALERCLFVNAISSGFLPYYKIIGEKNKINNIMQKMQVLAVKEHNELTKRGLQKKEKEIKKYLSNKSYRYLYETTISELNSKIYTNSDFIYNCVKNNLNIYEIRNIMDLKSYPMF